MDHNSKKDFWLHHIEQWGKSDLSQVEYCTTNNIALSTFGYWKRKLSQKDNVKPVFYPLAVSPIQSNNDDPNGSGITLHLKGDRFSIGIEKGFSPSTLSQIISTIEKL